MGGSLPSLQDEDGEFAWGNQAAVCFFAFGSKTGRRLRVAEQQKLEYLNEFSSSKGGLAVKGTR